METKLPAEPSIAFALQLRSLRDARGLSVRALAFMVGVSKVAIWKWEGGDNEPRGRVAAALARALDVSPDQLGLSTDSREMVSGRFEGQAGLVDLRSSPPAETLPEVIARAKKMIATASGTKCYNIKICIKY